MLYDLSHITNRTWLGTLYNCILHSTLYPVAFVVTAIYTFFILTATHFLRLFTVICWQISSARHVSWRITGVWLHCKLFYTMNIMWSIHWPPPMDNLDSIDWTIDDVLMMCIYNSLFCLFWFGLTCLRYVQLAQGEVFSATWPCCRKRKSCARASSYASVRADIAADDMAYTGRTHTVHSTK